MNFDARTKLIIIALFTTLSVMAMDLGYLLIILIAVLAFDLIFSVDLITAIKRLRHLLSLIVFISIAQSLSVKSGTPLIYFGNFYLITSGGLISGGEFALRMTIIIMASLIAATSSSKEMVDGLIKMKIPYELAFMTSIALRFLPVFREEFSARLNAIALRGIDIKRQNLIKKVKIYSFLFMPTVSSSIIRSKQLAKSIEARGFQAYPKRTMFRQMKMNKADYVIIIISLTFFVSYLAIMYSLGGLL